MTRVLLTAAGVPLAIWGPAWSAIVVLSLLVLVVVVRLVVRGHE